MTIICHLVGAEVFVRRLRVLKPFFAVPMKRQKRCVQLRLHYGNSVALAPSSSWVHLIGHAVSGTVADWYFPGFAELPAPQRNGQGVKLPPSLWFCQTSCEFLCPDHQW